MLAFLYNTFFRKFESLIMWNKEKEGMPMRKLDGAVNNSLLEQHIRKYDVILRHIPRFYGR